MNLSTSQIRKALDYAVWQAGHDAEFARREASVIVHMRSLLEKAAVERSNRKLERKQIVEPEEVTKLKAARRRIATWPGMEVVQFAPDSMRLVVTGYEVYRSDIKVIHTPVEEPQGGGGERGAITYLSQSARERLRFFVANSDTVSAGMVTLTYPSKYSLDGRALKREMDNFLRSCRRKWEGRFEYLWFLEFQRRGAPHVHMLTAGSIHDAMDKRVKHKLLCDRSCCVTLGKPLGNEGNAKCGKHNRCRVVFRGEPESWLVEQWLHAIGAESDEAAQRFNRGGIWEPIHSKDGAAHYVAKETYKCHQKDVPKHYQNVGRFWARSKGWSKPECLHHHTGDARDVREKLGMSETDKLFPRLFNQSRKHNKPTIEKLNI